MIGACSSARPWPPRSRSFYLRPLFLHESLPLLSKRLMLLATVWLLPPALGRITGYSTLHENSTVGRSL